LPTNVSHCWSNSDGTSKRTAGERAVVLLELSEGAVGERMITFGAEEFAKHPLGREHGSQGLQVRRELLLQELRDRFRLATELRELLNVSGFARLSGPAIRASWGRAGSLAFRCRPSTAD